jgi:hypothetical protein
MKARILAVLPALGALAGCNLWGSSVPSSFQGWFHYQNAGRTENLSFGSSNLLEIHDLGCDQSFTVFQEWTTDGNALVATQSPGEPHFTPDPTIAGALQASPGMFGPDTEEWLPGASCPVCLPGDAGVVSCDTPRVLDGGAP